MDQRKRGKRTNNDLQNIHIKLKIEFILWLYRNMNFVMLYDKRI